MPQTLNDLADNLDKLNDDLHNGASNTAKDIALRIVTYLVQDTPVDTSRALSNWLVSLGSAISAHIEPYVSGKRGSSQQASIATAIGIAKTILDGKTPGVPIFIQNNIDYISHLNEGSSSQAPAGFIEAAVLLARKTIGKVLK